MYYPILRGKLNELLALRELSNLSIDKKFCPLIEPVREEMSPLIKTIKELNDNGMTPNIIINPRVGDLSHKPDYVLEQLQKFDSLRYVPCIVINENTNVINHFKSKVTEYGLFVTDGLSQEIINETKNAKFTFINCNVSPNLLKQMTNVILYSDFFKRQKRNADYSAESIFSSLHTYYKDYKAIGFGDYTLIGEEYSESGGPAYVVTIHASYIDDSRFKEMFVRHYSSQDDGTPTNPGNKFKEALKKLIHDIDHGIVDFTKTTALKDFEKISISEHFPGLGQIKKISMKHHIETINNYLIIKN